MSAPGQSPRSLAVELALLFLHELEPLVAEDPERLVSTEAVLSFAAVRRADPFTWQRWYRILEKYDKADLIEHMLGEPVPLDPYGGGVREPASWTWRGYSAGTGSADSLLRSCRPCWSAPRDPFPG